MGLIYIFESIVPSNVPDIEDAARLCITINEEQL